MKQMGLQQLCVPGDPTSQKAITSSTCQAAVSWGQLSSDQKGEQRRGPWAEETSQVKPQGCRGWLFAGSTGQSGGVDVVGKWTKKEEEAADEEGQVRRGSER